MAWLPAATSDTVPSLDVPPNSVVPKDRRSILNQGAVRIGPIGAAEGSEGGDGMAAAATSNTSPSPYAAPTATPKRLPLASSIGPTLGLARRRR